MSQSGRVAFVLWWHVYLQDKCPHLLIHNFWVKNNIIHLKITVKITSNQAIGFKSPPSLKCQIWQPLYVTASLLLVSTECECPFTLKQFVCNLSCIFFTLKIVCAPTTDLTLNFRLLSNSTYIGFKNSYISLIIRVSQFQVENFSITFAFYISRYLFENNS